MTTEKELKEQLDRQAEILAGFERISTNIDQERASFREIVIGVIDLQIAGEHQAAQNVLEALVLALEPGDNRGKVHAVMSMLRSDQPPGRA